MKKIIPVFMALFITSAVCAQNKIIKGNGNIGTRNVSIAPFTQLSIDMYCDVHLQLGAMEMATIEGDKNVINKIDLDQSGGALEIKVKEGYCLQNSRPKIYLQTPFISKLITKGHQTNIGKVVIEKIELKKFETDILYGTISLIGEVDELYLKSSNRSYYGNRGIVYASQLIADVVNAEILGSNSVIVNPVKSLKAKLKYDASLEYITEPEELILSGDAIAMEKKSIGIKTDNVDQKVKKPKARKRLDYITVKVKNNSMKRRHFVIKGPNESGRGFSYGFPMMPLAVRERKVPVGTKILLQKGDILNKKLLTITAENEGQTLNLFN